MEWLVVGYLFFVNPPQVIELPRADGVEVNLDDMELTLWKDGISKEYEVLSIRDIGSIFDTPTGDFTALNKEDNHFSSFGKVWMPYSVRFKGDYYIHGWPYYPDGTPVAQGYSGGCVRLDTEDMKELYQLIDLDMPIKITKEV